MAVNRISGLTSGMDIDSMVKQMMSSHKAPVTKMMQKKQTIEWQRDDYRAMNTKLTDFRNNKIFNFMLDSNFNTKKAQVTGTSVSATLSKGASSGSVTIEVEELAKTATQQSSNFTTDDSFDPNASLYDQMVAGKISGTPQDQYVFQINGKQVVIDDADHKMTLNQVMKQITKETDVNAFYDSFTRTISFSAKKPGMLPDGDAKITFAEDSSMFLTNILKMDPSKAVAGSNAKVIINGVETERPGNTFDFNGISITVKDKGISTINVTADTDKMVDSIKGFIKDYNDVLSSLNAEANEQRYRNFTPLTEEQKKEFKDKGYDLDEWEKKAKSGLLRNDSILSRTIQSMRNSVIQPVMTGDDQYTTLASIGITQERYAKGSDKNGGLILSDEAKLREALEKNPEAVYALFAGKGTGDGNSDGVADRKDVGIAERLYSDLKDSLNQLYQKAGNPNATFDTSILNTQIYNLDRDISNANDRLNKLENNYYKQFSRLETAMSKINSQSQYLTNAFGGGQ